MSEKDKFKKVIDLFLISFITLYFEILFIRWIPSSIHIIAYFANIILISSFLGLGIGCLLSDIKFDLMNLFPFLIFDMVALIMGFNKIEVAASSIREEYLLGFYGAEGVNFLVIIAIIFIFNTLMFIPVGQKLGLCLRSFRPLIAYSLNISGSILGVVVFSYLSYLMLNPFSWFLLGLIITLWFYASSGRKLLLQASIIVLILFMIPWINRGSYWSPYYKIDIQPLVSNKPNKIVGSIISSNNIFYQYAFNLSDKSVDDHPEVTILRHYKDIYEFPYKFLHPNNTLILGAGSGNDAAAALRMGLKDIYAVEIDPLIASLGKELHGEKPYLSKDVHLFIDDARSFIRKADRKFDLVSFGYLDSQKVLSQFSSVRLDNFIYTKESFSEIKDHLNSNGILSLTYYVFREWIGARLYVTLKEIFGDNVKVFRNVGYTKDNTAIFLAGNKVKDIKEINVPNFKLYEGFDKNVEPTTDDWPYLYLTGRGIPSHYIIILFFIFLISCLGIFYARPEHLSKFNTHFFFLGAGFMLLETVSITRFALLFGSTWIVNSAVIISILIMILFANLYVAKSRKINIQLLYILLIFSILLNWLLKPDFYFSFNRLTGVALSSFVLSLPLLFAGIIFAISFKQAKDVSGVFAYNLLGAIVGGFCEYISMATGFRFLFIIAMLIYFFSYLGLNKKALLLKIN